MRIFSRSLHHSAALFISAILPVAVCAQSPAAARDTSAAPRRTAQVPATKWTRVADVQQTSFDREKTVAEADAESVTFGQQPLHVGDQSEQTVMVEMRMKLIMRRENELLGSHQSTVRTSQHRVVTTNAVEGDRVTAVAVRYPEAAKQVVAAEAPTAPAADGTSTTDATAQYQPITQPVQGKTYLCRREPGDNGKLIVTDETGNPPPKEELDIVAPQMETVGRPNPLVQFLAGRTVRVGQQLDVPRDLASRIFNLGDKFGEISRFTLTLKSIRHDAGADYASFVANVEATSHDASQMRLEVEGPLTVQVDSCRATEIGLVGPIGLSETRGSYSTACQVIGTGRLQLNIASAFHESTQKSQNRLRPE